MIMNKRQSLGPKMPSASISQTDAKENKEIARKRKTAISPGSTPTRFFTQTVEIEKKSADSKARKTPLNDVQKLITIIVDRLRIL